MATLLETYKNRINVAEQVYAKSNNGAKMDNNRKVMIATVLNNTNKFLSEAFENSVGTQRSDLGLWKKFALNLTNVALPNLIAPELVITHPMTSMSGYVVYCKYTAGTKKGETERGKLLNDPFKLGDVDVNYTAARVVETDELQEDEESGDVFVKLAWFPVYNGEDEASHIQFLDPTTNEPIVGIVIDEENSDFETGKIVLAEGGAAGDEIKVKYVYDNIRIPQNDLPIVNVSMESIPLIAKARRIAVYYSQMAAFQAKTDYGFDMAEQLAEKAVGELVYEIDTEITDLLAETAGAVDADLTWSKTLPVGVSKAEHYEGFTEILEIARQKIYDATKRFAPNYMLCSSSLLPVLTFIKGFTAAPAGAINGPYFAGTLNGLKVFVTPNIDQGTFCVGVNGSDMASSVAVYAPYMAVVPTQLLQYADGGTSQGWSTLYDLKVLNPNLIVKGKIVA